MPAVLLTLLAILSVPPAETVVPARADFMRGMIVSCPRFGEVWGSKEMEESLRELDSLGVNWVSIHPYAGVRRDGSIRHWPAAETGYLDRAGEIVRRQNMKLFWKPHLAYWGSFNWRGAIDFGDDAAAWERFFTGYEVFIVDQAKFAEKVGAEIFAVGVELEGTTHFDDHWRRIIARVREVYSGALTYGANWDRLDAVPFWEALDLIGVHAYYPLSHESNPTREQIWQGWDSPLRDLTRLSKSLGDKPVFFAEIGYNRSNDAAKMPWDYRMDGDDNEAMLALRRRLMDVALTRIETVPFVQGMFWWKWIPGDWRHDRDFSMRNPEAREALAERWNAATASYSQEP